MSNSKRSPKRFRIQAEADKAPEVVLKKPVGEIEVLPNAILDLECRIVDDYGIRTIDIVYRLPERFAPAAAPDAPANQPATKESKPAKDAKGNAAQARSAPANAAPAPNEQRQSILADHAGKAQVELQAKWNLEPLKLQNGDVVTFIISATDDRDSPAPNVAAVKK